MNKKSNINYLKKISSQLKLKILEISFKKKAHHIGSCLSCVDILVVLFFKIMKFSKLNKDNDYFIMSKGHAALIYYLILMKKKFFSEKFLFNNFLTDNGKLGGHPDKNQKLGIDYCSGSLGHGISVGCGIATALLKDKKKNKVFVLIGDGECNEGMIWEALLYASHHNLNNLYVVIDYNKLQGFGSTTDILDLYSLKKKLKSFNWNVIESNGHNIPDLINKIEKLMNKKKKPNIIIANTIKGKGISFMQNKFESHYHVLNDDEYESGVNQILKENK